MKKSLICMSIFSILLMLSCSSRDWNISKFNMKSDALKDGEEVVILYASKMNNFPNMDMLERDDVKDFLEGYNIDIKTKTSITYIDYEGGYTQLVAVSQETNDTVNILTFHCYDWKNYKSETLNFYKVDYDVDATVDNKRELKKVARDPKFDYIADNNYPTIIGKVSQIEEK